MMPINISVHLTVSSAGGDSSLGDIEMESRVGRRRTMVYLPGNSGTKSRGKFQLNDQAMNPDSKLSWALRPAHRGTGNAGRSGETGLSPTEMQHGLVLQGHKEPDQSQVISVWATMGLTPSGMIEVTCPRFKCG